MESTKYLVSEWALIRRNELVDVPETFAVHPGFLNGREPEEFIAAFRDIHDMFYQIYTDMAQSPEQFGLPLHEADRTEAFSRQERETKSRPWDMFWLLLLLFGNGECKDDVFIVDLPKFHSVNRIKKITPLLEALSGYGFSFKGLKNYRLTPSSGHLEIACPDHTMILTVLSLAAGKVMRTQFQQEIHPFSTASAFSNGFISWNYKVFAEDSGTCSLAQGCTYLTDKLHSSSDRETAALLDSEFFKREYFSAKGDNHEGPSVRYFNKKSGSAYLYALTSWKGTLLLELRIRNAQKCMDYLAGCPDSIVRMFQETDLVCQNRFRNSCWFGVKYTFEGEEKWRCGCYRAPFRTCPVKQDIPHYLRLVELGCVR